MSEEPKARPHAVSRVIRRGELDEDERDEERSLTSGERMARVWELTKLCYAWGHKSGDEPRLQRSVVRTQRPRG